jgi:hypothetical protein
VIAASGNAFRSSLAVPSSFRMSRSVELRPQRSCSVGAPGANTNTPGSLSPASPAGSSHQTVANGGSRALVSQRPRGRGERQPRFRAVGVGSILAALIGAFAVDTSPPRTAVVEESGGRSKLAGLLAIAQRSTGSRRAAKRACNLNTLSGLIFCRFE